MSRSLPIFGACALSLIFCFAGHGQQDSPSLGDLARQAQKDKANTNAPTAKVFTNDDLPSSSGSGSPGAGGAGRVVQPGTTGKAGSTPSSADQLERMQSMLDQLASLDRATLAKNVLQGSDVDFPGRGKWEERLFAAKQTFVAQGRDVIKKANQLQASAKNVQDANDSSDVQAKILNNRLDQIMQEEAKSSAAFQSVVAEGRDLAGQTARH